MSMQTHIAAPPAAPVGALVLEVESLAKTFTMHHLGRHLPGFDGVGFTLRQGEFLLLTGENGAGKSTLLRALYRSYLPSSGRAMLHRADGTMIDLAVAADIDIAFLRRREIGFVTQFLQARPRVSAEELVAEPLHTAGWSHEAARAQARRMLGAFALKTQLWPAYPSTFSGGEQQKVNLARALVLPPRLLFLDEPTASLDRAARAALVERLRGMKTAGMAMIGVFHHPEDVAELVDRELRLVRSGHQEEMDDPEE